MSRIRCSTGVGAILLALALLASREPVVGLAPDTLPSALTDSEFWSLSERISEPDGFFRSNSGSSDNLLSNEDGLSAVAAALGTRVKPSGIYLGVGPEQNFTYIAATRPRLAFITDIRRGNLHLHLLYKALFEISNTRADFVARLFSRKRPAGLTSTSTALELMSAYIRVAPDDEAAFRVNLKAVTDHLTKTRGLPLGRDELTGIEYVYENFHRFGPGINYTSSIGRGGGAITYAALMATRDTTGKERSYLASEETFGWIKAMQTKNLIIPIVGDFAGPKALREVGAFLKEHSATVTAFYASNVEDYLRTNGVWQKFCANVAMIPIDTSSLFIRPGNRIAIPIGNALDATFSSMATETASCTAK